MQGKLNQFESGQVEAPYITKVVNEVPHVKKLGLDGFDNNLNFVTVNFRWRSDRDRFEKLNGYGFTLDALTAMKNRDISTIYIPDVTEGHIYEYSVDQYFGPNSQRPNCNNYGPTAPVVPVEYATIWKDCVEEFIEASDGVSTEKIKEVEKNF